MGDRVVDDVVLAGGFTSLLYWSLGMGFFGTGCPPPPGGGFPLPVQSSAVSLYLRSSALASMVNLLGPPRTISVRVPSSKMTCPQTSLRAASSTVTSKNGNPLLSASVVS